MLAWFDMENRLGLGLNTTIILIWLFLWQIFLMLCPIPVFNLAERLQMYYEIVTKKRILNPEGFFFILQPVILVFIAIPK